MAIIGPMKAKIIPLSLGNQQLYIGRVEKILYIYVSIYVTWTAHIHVDILFTILLLHDSRFDFIIVWATFIVRVSDEVVVMPWTSSNYHDRDGDNYIK